jgi:hypothetical protein
MSAVLLPHLGATDSHNPWTTTGGSPHYHRWRKQYGGLKANDAKRLKELSNENIRLKRIVADKELEIDALREVAKGNF